MEGIQKEIENLLNIITVLLVKLEDAEDDVVGEVKLILDKSRNEVLLIQHSLLAKYKQEECYDEDKQEECYDEEDSIDYKAEVYQSATNFSDSIKLEDQFEAVNVAPIKISFQRNSSEIDKDEFDSRREADMKREKTCLKCKKIFTGFHAFHECDAIHSYKKIRKCKRCEMLIRSLSEFAEHMKQVHNEEFGQGSFLKETMKYFQCPDCEYTSYKSNNVIRHFSRSHNNTIETCDVCGHVCKSKIGLQQHFREKHYAPEGETKCEQCLKCFPNENFDGHLCEVAKYICNVCGQAYKCKYSLKKHIQVVHEKVVLPKPFICHQCDFCAENKTYLKSHMKTHEEKKPCPLCGVKVRHLKRHMDISHTTDEMKKHQCQDCGKGFTDLGSLNTHRMNVHLKLKPYQCRYGCDISYNDISNRNQHEKKTHGKLFTTVREEKLKAELQ